MTVDFDIYGVYVPPLLLVIIGCYGFFVLLQRALSSFGVYRYVWHRSLFDVALYFSLLSLLILSWENFTR